MGFQQGLSGLNATSKNLEVIGNNIANASTYGAKASRAEFSDMYASAMNGAGANSIGIGVSLQSVSQQFTQGGGDIRRQAQGRARNSAILCNSFSTAWGTACAAAGFLTAGASCSASFLPSSTPH